MNFTCIVYYCIKIIKIFFFFNSLFVLVLIFSKKMSHFSTIIFFIKLYYFPLFGNNHKWVGKQSSNFPYLDWCEIKLFSKKKLAENHLLKISHTFFSWPNYFFFYFFFMPSNTRKYGKLFLYKVFHKSKQSESTILLPKS